MKKTVLISCFVLSALLPLLAGPAQAVECNNFCNVELAKSVANNTGNAAAVRSQCGGHAKVNRPARDVFKTGGSRNIPVTCHAVLYLEENTPTLRTWFEEYFQIQENPPGANGAGFMGDELLSPLYGPITAGPIIAVMDTARSRGHNTIVQRAEKWLRAYWALNTLAARSGGITTHWAVIRGGVQMGDGFFNSSRGVMTSAAGARMGSPLQGPFNLSHPMLALAMDIRPRRYTPSVTNSPGFYGGMRVAAMAAGYSFDSQGRITNFASRTAPLASMGITQAQRNALKGFLGGGWQSHFQTLKSMVGGFRPHCEMTFLRTTQGVMSWFGTSSTDQRICNRNKGPFFAVRLDNNGTAHYLTPATETTPDAGWKSFRQGNQICADTPNISGGPWCLNLPGGAVQYEISWTRAQGLQQVTGGPPPGNDNGAAVVSHNMPSSMTPGQSTTVSVTMRNTGDTTWYRDGSLGYKLGAQNQAGQFAATRHWLNVGETVVPGQSRTFTFNMTAPTTPGNYTVGWRMVEELVEWFGATATRNITVGGTAPSSVSVRFANSDVENGLERKVPEAGNAQTVATTIGGRTCRRNRESNDRHFFMLVDDGWAFQGNRPTVSVKIEYFDSGTDGISLVYDGTSGNRFAGTVNLTNTNTWKTHTWNLNDAYFGNRSGTGYDFRLSSKTAGATFYLFKVEIID